MCVQMINSALMAILIGFVFFDMGHYQISINKRQVRHTCNSSHPFLRLLNIIILSGVLLNIAGGAYTLMVHVCCVWVCGGRAVLHRHLPGYLRLAAGGHSQANHTT